MNLGTLMTTNNFPVLGVGAIVFRDDCILLVRRKHPPQAARWAIPGGKVRFGESLSKAAEREIQEETGITIKAREPVYTFEVIERDAGERVVLHYVVVDLLADYVSGQPLANDDALDAAWIDRASFKTLDVNETTKALLKDRFNFP